MLYEKKLKQQGMFVFAHRGASSIFHENSIKAIKKAIELECDGVEVDIQRTKDNKIILFHDDHIYINKKVYWINKITHKKALSLFRKLKRPEPALLSDLYQIILKEENTVFNIEIKTTQINNKKILFHANQIIPKNILKRNS